MFEHCERIKEAITQFGGDFEHFTRNPDYRDVVCMNIFQVGERSNQVSEEIQITLSDIPKLKTRLR